MGTRTVSVDVGMSMVRVAEVEVGTGSDPRSSAVLHSVAERPMVPGIIRDGTIEDPATLAAIVRETLAAARVKSRHLTFGLAHQGVMVREVDVPSQQASSVKSSLAFQIGDQLPMNPDEAVLDFYPTAELESAQGPTLRGLLVASPKQVVRDIVSVVDMVKGYSLAAIDHSALGLWRSSVQGPLVGRPVAIVDVGASRTIVVVSQQGGPRLIRTLSQSVADARTSVANALRGNTVDEDRLIREIGMDPQAQGNARVVSEAVQFGLNPLIDAVRNTLVYFSSSNPGSALDGIVLTGGGSYVRGFAQALSGATRLPVLVGDPLASLKLSKGFSREAFLGREAELSTVIGLALRSTK